MAFPVFVTLALFVSIAKGEELAQNRAAKCPPGWLVRNDSCYILLPRLMNFKDAVKVCAAPGITLVVPESQEEHEIIWREMHSWMKRVGTGTASDMWIGCWKLNGGQITCQGGNNINAYEYWATEEPSNKDGEDCIRMRRRFDGKLADRICSKYYFVACEGNVSMPGHCRSPTRFIQVPRMCLLNHEIRNIPVGGFEGCSMACLIETLCHSFNILQQTDGVTKCQLNHATINQTDIVDSKTQTNPCSLFKKYN